MDELELQCPHCRGLIGITDEGEVVALVEPTPLKENQRLGIGGLVTEHSGDQRFLEYEPKREPTFVVQPLGERKPKKERKPEKTEPIVPDEGLMKAAANDLKQRNIH